MAYTYSIIVIMSYGWRQRQKEHYNFYALRTTTKINSQPTIYWWHNGKKETLTICTIRISPTFTKLFLFSALTYVQFIVWFRCRLYVRLPVLSWITMGEKEKNNKIENENLNMVAFVHVLTQRWQVNFWKWLNYIQ